MIIIKTSKFLIREYKTSDAPAAAQALNNKNIIKNLALDLYPYKVEDAKVFINKNIKAYKNPDADGLSYAIFYKNQFAGSIGVHQIKKRHKASIGYWLAEDFWGQGIMSNVVKKFCIYLFKKYKLKRIYAEVFTYNPGSKRVLEKAGFELEGIKKKDHKKVNKFIDVYLMAKVK